MSETRLSEQALVEQLNELYWKSELTVEEIGTATGVGQNTLYGALRPMSAGASCPACGERLVYTSRMNRGQGRATCRECGNVVALAPRRKDTGPLPGQGAGPVWDEIAAGGKRSPREWKGFKAQPGSRVTRLGMAAALGAIVGSLTARSVRETR